MTQHRRGRVDVVRLAPSLRVLAIGGFGGFVVVSDAFAATHSWETLANGRSAAVAAGVLFGFILGVLPMGIRVRDGEVTIRGLWFTWRGDVWSVRGATNASALRLEIRLPPTRDGRRAGDVSIDVTAVQGSVIEQLRGNTRADGAIRRLRNAQAATPVRAEPAPLRRSVRVLPLAGALGCAAAQWLLVTAFWGWL